MQQFNMFGGVDELEFNKETEKFDIVMNEDRLQFDMVLCYRNELPYEKMDFWSTRNQTFSGKDGQKQKGMGMLAGVSDLIYDGHFFIGLEVKVRGKKHGAEHIKQQLDWGKRRIEKGGYWCIVVSVEGFKSALKDPTLGHKDIYHVEDVEKLLATGKKTIIF